MEYLLGAWPWVLNSLLRKSLWSRFYCLFSHSVMFDSLWPHGLQHARLPCPSPSSRVSSNSCPMKWWCHPTISSCVISSSFCLQSFPASGSFPLSQLCIRWPTYWSFGFSIHPCNEYSGLISLRIDWFDLLAVKGLSRVYSSTTVWKHRFSGIQPSLWSNSHVHTWPLEKP